MGGAGVRLSLPASVGGETPTWGAKEPANGNFCQEQKSTSGLNTCLFLHFLQTKPSSHPEMRFRDFGDVILSCPLPVEMGLS